MGISDARHRANDKWRSKFEEVRFRVPIGEKSAIQEHAAKQGESVNAFLDWAVEEAMARDAESQKL